MHNGIQAFQYSGLKITDATGKTLPGWLSYRNAKSGGVLDIHIDDSSAAYPVTVDPRATSGWSDSVANGVGEEGQIVVFNASPTTTEMSTHTPINVGLKFPTPYVLRRGIG
jgi:hypothetical protein